MKKNVEAVFGMVAMLLLLASVACAVSTPDPASTNRLLPSKSLPMR